MGEKTRAKMWCANYASSEGVPAYDGWRDGEHFVPDGFACTYWMIGVDAFETEKEALEAAEEMRLEEIRSLEKRIKKLREMSFSVNDDGE